MLAFSQNGDQPAHQQQRRQQLPTQPSGALFRSLPWICRYLKLLLWSPRQAKRAYFQDVFGVLRRLREHPYLQPCGRMYRGVAALCLRGMLDDLLWLFPEEGDAKFQSRTKSKKLESKTWMDASLDATLGEDILWANENLGRRYLEVTVPDLSYLESVVCVSVKTVISAHAMKAVKKIRPTAPSSSLGANAGPATRVTPGWLADGTGPGDAPAGTTGGRGESSKGTSVDVSSTVIGGNEWSNPDKPDEKADTNRARNDVAKASMATARSNEETLKELERVFLDQYSTSARVTDVKLRDFVTWCSDAVARQGIAAGLDAAATSHLKSAVGDVLTEARGMVAQRKLEASKLALAARASALRDACASIEEQAAAKHYRAVKGPSVEALKRRVIDSSKSSADILLPQAWGEHVKMTAAAIVARRAEAASTRQLLAELKRVGLSEAKAAVDAEMKTKE